jgi:hypothetical protein
MVLVRSVVSTIKLGGRLSCLRGPHAALPPRAQRNGVRAAQSQSNKPAKPSAHRDLDLAISGVPRAHTTRRAPRIAVLDLPSDSVPAQHTKSSSHLRLAARRKVRHALN